MLRAGGPLVDRGWDDQGRLFHRCAETSYYLLAERWDDRRTREISTPGSPPERIWSLLSSPFELERWLGVKLLAGSGRPIAVGDRLVFGAGLGHLMQVE